jgi:hypothetical protein
LGRLRGRLERLEAQSKEQALNALRRAFATLSDREIALTVETGGRLDRNPEEQSVAAKVEALGIEELMAAALGPTTGLSSERIDGRVREVVRQLGVFERGAGIRRHMESGTKRRR